MFVCTSNHTHYMNFYIRGEARERGCWHLDQGMLWRRRCRWIHSIRAYVDIKKLFQSPYDLLRDSIAVIVYFFCKDKNWYHFKRGFTNIFLFQLSLKECVVDLIPRCMRIGNSKECISQKKKDSYHLVSITTQHPLK